MSRKLYGTRFTTQCGHSWRRRELKWTIRDLSFATTDCRVCGELLIMAPEQFEDETSESVPFDVHCILFHPYIHAQDPRWPKDGANTGYVSFRVDE